MTHSRIGVPLVVHLYRAFVAAMLMCYAAFGLMPFVLSGTWMFSYSEISSQAGVPGYPFGPIGLLLVLLSGLLAPIASIPALLVWGPMLLRGEVPPAARRALLPALVAQALYFVFVLSYGQIILTWILD